MSRNRKKKLMNILIYMVYKKQALLKRSLIINESMAGKGSQSGIHCIATNGTYKNSIVLSDEFFQVFFSTVLFLKKISSLSKLRIMQSRNVI